MKGIVGNTAMPAAFVLAGHNGSGKSTMWAQLLSDELQIPLINADRLTESILPPRNVDTQRFPEWAERLRDHDTRWQKLSQQGVQAFTSLAVDQKIPFAFETVFSHPSKIELIRSIQSKGYIVVLLFVGLASKDLSLMRVESRKAAGGHHVPVTKLRQRFSRTQKCVGQAALVADLTLMVDNSRSVKHAFSVARIQDNEQVYFDCRDPAHAANPELRAIAGKWLNKVVGPLMPSSGTRRAPKKKK